MTYLVLARKWRPRSFDTLVGQDHVVRALTHALDTQRLHHAWLFTGTRGVGKTTLSRILAKSLNCEQGITAHPCGRCRACTEIDAGRYVDYVELDAASNRGVDEMTQLLEQAVYAPGSARFKVYMIDEVHMLTGHAFNAMLKTLEEPPPHVKFILATTDPQKIPVTVLSRCLQFNLKHMTVDAIVGHLQSILGEEGMPFDAPALRLLGQAAGGSMRDALSLTDQAIAYSAGNLTLEAVQGMLGTIDRRHLVRLLQALAAGRAADVLGVADELASRGLSYAGALADLAVLLSHIAIQQRVPGAMPGDDPLAADVEALAAGLHPDLVQLYYSIAVHSRSELSLAPDEYAGFVMACLRMLSLTPEAAHASEPPPSGGRRAPPAAGADASGPAAAAPPAAAPVSAASTAAATAPGSGDSRPGTPAVAGTAPAASMAGDASVGPAAAAAADEPAAVSATAAPAVASSEDDGPDVPAWEALPGDTGTSAAEAPSGQSRPPARSEPLQTPRSIEPPEASQPPRPTEPPEASQPPRPTEPLEAPEPPRPTEPPEALEPPRQPDAPRAPEPAPQPEPPRASAPPEPQALEPSGASAAAASHAPEPAREEAPVSAGLQPDDADAFSDGPPAGFAEDGGAMGGMDPDASGYADGDSWEPVMDDAGFEAVGFDSPGFTSPGFASLPQAEPASPARMPRLARMNAKEWPALAASLPLTGLAAQLARQSEWVGVEGDCVTLRVAIHSLAARQGQARLRTVLTEHFGKVVQLAVEFGATGDGTAHAVEQVRRAERQKEAESAVANDAFVRSLIEEFGARVMPGSIAALDNERAA